MNQKNSAKSKQEWNEDWFYMSPNEVTAKMIADLLKLQHNIVVDLWEEMNIVEIEIKNKTIDFEPIRPIFKDPTDAAFINNRNIKTIFTLKIDEEIFDNMKSVIKLIIQEWDGFLCADSPDFNPILKLEGEN